MRSTAATREALASLPAVHWFWLFIVWMVYATLVMGVLEALSERDERLVRGAGTALIVGALLAVVLSIFILWTGPPNPFV